MKMQSKDAALAACISGAQADADRFHGTGAVPAWDARPRRSARRWLLALVAMATGVAAAMIVQPEETGARSTAASNAAPAKLDRAALQPRAVATAPAAAALPIAPPRIERVGGELVIELSAWPRARAAAELAALTGSQLLGAPDALERAGALTLHWRGRDPGAAWRALLGDAASHAMRCGAHSCQVWVFGAFAAPSGAALPHGSGSAAADAMVTAALSPAHAEAVSSGVLPMQPDPPGLFPSESPSATD
jgi:hypothetical protein